MEEKHSNGVCLVGVGKIEVELRHLAQDFHLLCCALKFFADDGKVDEGTKNNSY